jgi:hypothetical protein
MFRIWAAGLLLTTLAMPACAAYTSLYAGAQLDNNTTTGLLGYQIDKNWAAEVHASRYVTTITQAGATNETQILAAGLSALYMIPMKLNGGSPYFFFGKIGYERTSKDVTYSFPASVTYSGSYNNLVNRGRFGIGAQYDFYEHLSGRAGIDVMGPDRSVYLTAIFKF